MLRSEIPFEYGSRKLGETNSVTESSMNILIQIAIEIEINVTIHLKKIKTKP